MCGRHDPLSLCCLRVVPAWAVGEKCGFLGSLRSALPCDSEAVVFVAGDFNFLVGEGRLNVSTDRVAGGSDSVASHFDSLFDDLIEIVQDRPIRRRSEGGTMTVLSRADRIYSNLPPGELLARSACAATLAKLASQCELSGHVPVVARLCGKTLVSGYRPFVPDWVLGLSCFPSFVSDFTMAGGLTGPGGGDFAPFERLKELKRVIVKAVRRAAEEARAGECDSPSACLHWIARAKSAVRARDLDRLRDIVGRAPKLSPFFDCGEGFVVDPHALRQFCHSCVRDEIHEQIMDFKGSELPGEEKSANTNRLHVVFRLGHRKVGGFLGLLFWGREGVSLMAPSGTSRDTGRNCLTTLGAVMLRLMPLGVSSSSVLMVLGLSLGKGSMKSARLTGGLFLALVVSPIGLGRLVVGKPMIFFTIVIWRS